MPTISGRVIFDKDRSAAISSGDSGLSNISVVLQDRNTNVRLTVLTDTAGNYSFINVPNGRYRIVESYGTTGGFVSPGDFSNATVGAIPQGIAPPATVATDPPPGTTNLDFVTPATLLVTVLDADLSNQNFFNGPVIYTPVQTVLDLCAAISGENQINAAEGGTFGTFVQGTPANTGAPTEPYPGVTPDFTYVLPNPAAYTPASGEYTVQNLMNNTLGSQSGIWWRIADHTMGNETGRMMVVSGLNSGAVFFRSVVAVQPNRNYLFTAWILNLFKVLDYPNPELGVRILDQNGGVLYHAALDVLIPVNLNAPEWKQIGSVINSQNNTSLTVEFLNEGTEGSENNYAIDDISFYEIQAPQFTPVKTVDRQTVNIGETVRFSVTMTNTCTSALTSLFFQDTIPNGLSFVPGSVVINGIAAPSFYPDEGFPLPDVISGQTVTVSFAARAICVPMQNPALNRAFIYYSYAPVEGGIPGNFQAISNEVPVLVEVEALADISVEKTADPSSAFPGERLTYTLTVSNAGPFSATNVILRDPPPDGLLDLQYSLDGGVTCQPWTGTLTLGTISNGTSRMVQIWGTVSQGATGIISNTAVVSSDTPDPNPDNNRATEITPVSASADLLVTKIGTPDPAMRGELLFYTITVTNLGPDMAREVALIDNPPLELCDVQFSVDSGFTWDTWRGTYALGDLIAGQSQTLLLRGSLSPLSQESIVNTAIVRSSTPDPDPTNNTATSDTPIQSGTNLRLTKIGPSFALRCQYLVYTLTVANLGPSDAQEVTLLDPLPAELGCPIVSLDGGNTWQSWCGSCFLGNLAPGSEVRILLAGITDPCARGSIVNTASVFGLTPEQEPISDTTTVVTPIQSQSCGTVPAPMPRYPGLPC